MYRLTIRKAPSCEGAFFDVCFILILEAVTFRRGVVVPMGLFLICMMGCLAFFGVVMLLIYRWIEADTYEYDMRYIWDFHRVTLEQMEFK
jgi:hypothetical protein